MIGDASDPDSRHPSRGAWIEISRGPTRPHICWSRTPHGVRGLKFSDIAAIATVIGRTPHRVRGLKCLRVPALL